MKKPHEEELKAVPANQRGGFNIVGSDGVVAMVRTKGGKEWALLEHGYAADDGEWHTTPCWRTLSATCLPECTGARAALRKAGVIRG